MIEFIRKYTLCKLNKHYHHEKDGYYVSGLSYGRCHACGKIIRKDIDGVWRKNV